MLSRPPSDYTIFRTMVDWGFDPLRVSRAVDALRGVASDQVDGSPDDDEDRTAGEPDDRGDERIWTAAAPPQYVPDDEDIEWLNGVPTDREIDRMAASYGHDVATHEMGGRVTDDDVARVQGGAIG